MGGPVTPFPARVGGRAGESLAAKLALHTHTVPRTAKYGSWTQRLHQPLSLQMMEQMKMRSKSSGRAAEEAKAAAEAAREAHGVEANTEDAHRQTVRVASKAALMETLALRKRWLRFCEGLGARPAKQDELRRRATAALDKCARQLEEAEKEAAAGAGAAAEASEQHAAAAAAEAEQLGGAVAQGGAVAHAELEAGAELEAELDAVGASEEAEKLSAVEAVAEKAVADWEAEAEREEMLTAREAAAREEATATPDGRAADGQFKIFDPGGCVLLAVAVGLQRRRRWSSRSCRRCSSL